MLHMLIKGTYYRINNWRRKNLTAVRAFSLKSGNGLMYTMAAKAGMLKVIMMEGYALYKYSKQAKPE